MNRPLPLAAACCLLWAGAAHAQSSVSVYGLMDASVGQFQPAGSEKVWRAESGTMTTSFLGFKGTEDLGGGLKARFLIEHFLRLDSGSAGRFGADTFWARSAFVGLQGSFGSAQIGRNTTPLFVATLAFNPFGDSFGFAPSIRHWYAGGVGALAGDSGWSNSLAYVSPKFGGFSLSLLGNLGEGAAGATGKNTSFSASYGGGPFGATLAWQQVKNGGLPAGADKQDAWQLGAAYDLGVARLFAQAGAVKTDTAVDVQTRLYQLGASVPVGAGKLLASFGKARQEVGAASSTRKTFTVGYDYYLSKSTDVYAVLMNDKATNLSTGNTAAVGLRLRF